MASIKQDQLRSEITAILKGADLTQLSSKKVRKQLEAKFGVDLTERKKEVDAMVMEEIKRQDEENDSASASESDFSAPEDMGPPEKKIKRSKVNDEDLARKMQDEEDCAGRRTRHGPKKPVVKRKKAAGSGEKKNSGYHRAMQLSPALAEIMGEPNLPRSEVVKRMWAVIKERNLSDPSNKQFMICDEQLFKVFGVKRVRTFGMMKYLKNHIYDAAEVTKTERTQSDDDSDNDGTGRNGAGNSDSDSEDEKPAKPSKAKSKGPKKASGYHKPLRLSPALADVMGQTEMPRSEVVKRMWALIKERNLADPSNKQFMICDDQLYKVFGVKRLKSFGMMKYLKDHMYSPEDVVDSS